MSQTHQHDHDAGAPAISNAPCSASAPTAAGRARNTATTSAIPKAPAKLEKLSNEKRLRIDVKGCLPQKSAHQVAAAHNDGEASAGEPDAGS